MSKDLVPQYHELMNPMLEALHELGGSGSIDEIYNQVVTQLNLPDEVVDVPHNPMLSFHVVFQCKRYQGSVSSAHVRDFRGAMVGRADKGLLITTGTFTRDAVREATRDGAPPIDLVDGDQLADKLKDFGLGLRTEIIEKVHVDEQWFAHI